VVAFWIVFLAVIAVAVLAVPAVVDRIALRDRGRRRSRRRHHPRATSRSVYP
jgi:hypothetical protein